MISSMVGSWNTDVLHLLALERGQHVFDDVHVHAPRIVAHAAAGTVEKRPSARAGPATSAGCTL